MAIPDGESESSFSGLLVELLVVLTPVTILAILFWRTGTMASVFDHEEWLLLDFVFLFQACVRLFFVCQKPNVRRKNLLVVLLIVFILGVVITTLSLEKRIEHASSVSIIPSSTAPEEIPPHASDLANRLFNIGGTVASCIAFVWISAIGHRADQRARQ